MFFKASILMGSLSAILLAAAFCSAQTNTTPIKPEPIRNEEDTLEDAPQSFRELMVKRRLALRKKEHDEMLERGEEALRISQKLENTYTKKGGLSADDRKQLANLEKLVTKIRNDLGGRDDAEKDEKTADSPKTLDEAFIYLKDSTETLVTELKRTTRYSISAVAIQTSNSVIKLARFLRLRK